MNLARFANCATAEKILTDNKTALHVLRTRMEAVREEKPDTFREYETLVRHADFIDAQLAAIKRLGLPILSDAAACLAVGPWAAHVFIFSRKIGAWQI